jgi:WD40 repeat protein
VNEDRIAEELREALHEAYTPAPWLLTNSMTAVRHSKPRRPFTWVAGLVAIVLGVAAIAAFESIMLASNPHAHPVTPVGTQLPMPIPQPITRTTAGAQVAWVSVQSQGQSNPSLVAVDPSGRVVARLDESTAAGPAGIYGVWRSADGSAIFTAGADQITSYSSLDGKVLRTYSRGSGEIAGDALSPDGHWLAVLLTGLPSFSAPTQTDLRLQLIDLRSGSSQILPVGHAPNARLPGTSCSGASCGVWGMVLFAPDSARLYTLTDWGGPARLTAFSVAGGKLSQTATAVDGQQGRSFPACSAPAMAASVVAAGQTLVAFCHGDGKVWFFDLPTLTISRVIDPHQGNPFWLSPIFTPDGQLLYLHQWPGFGDAMQVVDLRTGKLLGPVPMPTNLDQGGPLAWLFTNVYAGGVASTIPVSPDGLKLYSATDNGVMVLRVPDLKPLARLAPGLSLSEVWISGDGHTIYATSSDGNSLVVMSDDGGHQKSVTLPGPASGFVASEHG